MVVKAQVRGAAVCSLERALERLEKSTQMQHARILRLRERCTTISTRKLTPHHITPHHAASRNACGDKS
jgi:hypothetical protein